MSVVSVPPPAGDLLVEAQARLPAPAPPFRGRFAAHAHNVGMIRSQVTEFGRECGLQGSALGDLSLAVSEAATNAVIHGSLGIDNGHIRVSADLDDGRHLHVIVSDDGNGLKPRTDSPGSGFGLPIMAAVSEQLDVCSTPQGTEIHMTFPVPSAAPVRGVGHETQAI